MTLRCSLLSCLFLAAAGVACGSRAHPKKAPPDASGGASISDASTESDHQDLTAALSIDATSRTRAGANDVRQASTDRIEPVASTIVQGDAFRLNIDDREQAPESPPEGWCGETAIQEALLFFGAWYPQARINKAGRPRHPDLYASDIPVALKNLGLEYQRYGRRKGGIKTFLKWLKEGVRALQPTFTGVKIYPTQHPSWGLDHFVLTVGYAPDHVRLNTTWGSVETLSHAQLGSKRRGLSFKNRYGTFLGLRILGFAGRPDSEPAARLFPVSEDATKLEAIAACQGLTAGRRYEQRRYGSRKAKTTDSLHAFVAKGATFQRRVTIRKARPAIFRCVPAPETAPTSP